jgi:hypothetical protein
MNTKFQLFIIVIVALFSLSSHITILVSLANETGISRVHSKARNESLSTSEGNFVKEQSSPSIPVIPTSDEVAGFKGMNAEDDGVEHHFHFGRVIKCRRYARILCILAKVVLAVSHLALLFCCYCHLIHH